ncbi:hypothetical protein I9W82_001614 [Candida metapsilosis]|uniref:candidapepsin n=1 Tax=Candida metapsilosis TaxID=273372 RepID=A0A8H8DBD9_9ASCO|nr:hypothetical protein I9W82_001614 [Candida metapsilosis]
MKTTLIQNALLTTLLALQCEAAAISPRDDSKIIAMDMQLADQDEVADDGDVTKRDYIKNDLKFKKNAYTVELKIGSKKKKVKVAVDTGSSDLWVPTKNVQCLDKVKCKKQGTFQVEKSKTLKKLNEDFDIEYPDGTTASGEYVQDTIRFGKKKTLSNEEFAIVDKTNSEMGVMGIGLEDEEEVAGKDNKTYYNFVYSLKKAGYIGKAGYSLYFPEKDKKTGTIVFGGVDKDKYSGDLTTYKVSDKLTVPFESVSLDKNDYKNNTDVLIDTASRFSYLPKNVIEGIAKALDGSYNEDTGVYIVDCKKKNKKKFKDTFTFNFRNGLSIDAPGYQFVLKLKDIKDHMPKHEKNKCGLTIFPADDESVLGDNFLRNAYVSVNLEDKSIGMAQVEHSKHHSYQSL